MVYQILRYLVKINKNQCFLMDSKVTPLAANYSFTLVRYVGSGYPKQAAPPDVEVL